MTSNKNNEALYPVMILLSALIFLKILVIKYVEFL